MATLKKGDQAPSFSLVDQEGKEVKLSDFKGKKVLLYFYSKTDTSGCTKQACSVRDSRSELHDLGVAALGISPDGGGHSEEVRPEALLGFPSSFGPRSQGGGALRRLE